MPKPHRRQSGLEGDGKHTCPARRETLPGEDPQSSGRGRAFSDVLCNPGPVPPLSVLQREPPIHRTRDRAASLGWWGVGAAARPLLTLAPFCPERSGAAHTQLQISEVWDLACLARRRQSGDGGQETAVRRFPKSRLTFLMTSELDSQTLIPTP